MMQKKIKFIIPGLLLLVTIISCEKNVDIDIDEIETMIVMNGILQADSSVNIYLTRTRHILDNRQIDIIKDADVEIFDPQGNSKKLAYNSNNLYSTNQFIPVPGVEYKVKASKKGFADVEATCIIPEQVKITSVDTASSVNEWGDKLIDFNVLFNDPPGEDNYYLLSIRADREVANTEFFYYEDTLYVDLEKDTVVIGYRRDSSIITTRYNDNVWFESEDLAIEQWDYNSNRIVFSDKLFDGKTYSITGSFQTWFLYDLSDSATVTFTLHSIDPHYFKYLDSRQDHYNAKDDPFAVPVVVHSNIENGVGILGGMSVDTYSVRIAPFENKWDYYIY